MGMILNPNRIKSVYATLTTDAAGDATWNAVSSTLKHPVNGRLLAIQIDYSATAPATTDITITSDSPSDTLLQLTNKNTDGIWYPRNQVCSNNEGALAVAGDNLWDYFIVQGNINITIAQGGNTKIYLVRIYYS